MATEFREKQNAVFIGFALGAISLVPSIIALYLSNSLTMLTEILISASETAANLLSWLALRKVARGKTQEYNYGHGKWENLSSLIVASVMFMSVGVVIYSVVNRLFWAPVQVHASGVIIGMIITGFSAAINVWLWRKNYLLAQKEHSPIMESQWRLFRAKVVTNICALISFSLTLALSHFSWSMSIDPIFSVILSAFLFFSAYSVFTNSVYDLLDKTLDESLQMVILKELAVFYNDYEELHGITSRRSGANIYIELLLEFDDELKMAAVQETIDNIRASLQKNIQNSIVLIAPVKEPLK